MAPGRRVAFLDTDAVDAPEVRASDGGSTHNRVEASLCVQLLLAYCACGVPPSSLALISPYRAQLRHIRSLLPADVLGGCACGDSPPCAQ